MITQRWRKKYEFSMTSCLQDKASYMKISLFSNHELGTVWEKVGNLLFFHDLYKFSESPQLFNNVNLVCSACITVYCTLEKKNLD